MPQFSPNPCPGRTEYSTMGPLSRTGTALIVVCFIFLTPFNLNPSVEVAAVGIGKNSNWRIEPEKRIEGQIIQGNSDLLTFPVKRSAFGLFGLGTKRPHKAEADLIYRPPSRETFIPVRGRRRTTTLFGIERGGGGGSSSNGRIGRNLGTPLRMGGCGLGEILNY